MEGLQRRALELEKGVDLWRRVQGTRGGEGQAEQRGKAKRGGPRGLEMQEQVGGGGGSLSGKYPSEDEQRKLNLGICRAGPHLALNARLGSAPVNQECPKVTSGGG